MADPSINVTGVPADYATPGNFLEINFGVGPAAGFEGEYAILIIGNKTSAGSGTVDTVVYGPTSNPPLQSETDCIAIAGPGSEAHRLWRRVVAVNKTTPVYMILPTESGGTAASLTITLSTTATASGTLRVHVGDDQCDVPIASGDTPTNVADLAKIAVNNKTYWPVTMNNTAGAMLFTAKQKGPRGNEIRIWTEIIGTPATATDVAVSTPLASGATADVWTTALATILPARYYFIVSPDSSVSGNTFDDLVTQVISQAQPLTGIRQVVIAGSVDTQSNASALAANASINTPRAQIVWHYKSELTAGELAASMAAVRAQFESKRASWNFDGFGSGVVGDTDTSQYWRVPAQKTQSAWATASSIETALKNGITPIRSRADGGTEIVSSITTKHKNGSNFDYRVRDTHIVAIEDRFGDELLAEYRTKFGGKSLANDPAQGEPLPHPSVITPTRNIRPVCLRMVDKYADNGLLKNRSTIKTGIQVIVNGDNQSRSGTKIPLQAINLDHSNVISIDDNSSATS